MEPRREYYVFWSEEDESWVATGTRYPSLSQLEDDPVEALQELRALEDWVTSDLFDL